MQQIDALQYFIAMLFLLTIIFFILRNITVLQQNYFNIPKQKLQHNVALFFIFILTDKNI